MIHKGRRFLVCQADSVEELAEKLTEYSWTGCTGFSLDGVLFLNDSSGGDSPQDFAIVRDGIQFESVTFGWCSRDEAEEAIRRCLATRPEEYPMRMAVTNRIDRLGAHGVCGHCA